jgi:Putative auto-transporter adhesin, head GIN domain
MRRYTLPLVILAAVVIALVLTWVVLGGSGGRRDRDEVPAETRALAPFKRIQLSGSTTVNLVQDTNGPLIISATPRSSPRVTARVQGDTLIVFASDNSRWWKSLFGRGPGAAPQLTIHFKDLDAIEVAGGVRISAREVRVPSLNIEGSGGTSLSIDDLRTSTLHVTGAGALKAVLAGQVTDQSISVSGAGDYQAGKLISDNAVVDVSGAGKIIVNARKTLKASISGAGVVEYLGDPVVKESISGIGRVKRRESAEVAGPHIALAN